MLTLKKEILNLMDACYFDDDQEPDFSVVKILREKTHALEEMEKDK